MQKIINELKKLEENGQIRTIPNISEKDGNTITINGMKYINFASNDYLGIGSNKELQQKFLSVSHALLSSASARLLSGSSKEFKKLEMTLAELFNKDSALIFNTGYQCNLGVISTLCAKGDVVFSDKLNHASIIDGMRLSEGDFIRYNHLDYEHLEKVLREKRNTYKRALIVSESVFSMDGDIADIDKLIELKEKYNCLLMIDEAHAFCAYGNTLAGVSCGKNVDIISATFGKSLGSFGAFCVSNRDIINYLINKARSFIFSTSIPPLNIEWSNWLLVNNNNYLIEQKGKLYEITEKAHKLLDENNIKTQSKTHIIPIIIGNNTKTLKVSEKLKSLGYYIPAIRPPTVPEGTSRLRLSLTAETSFEDLLNVIKTVKPYI